VAKKYSCGSISDDLVSAGIVAVLEQIDRYDEQQGATATTFLYPHIIGAMRRETERYLGLSRRERQAEEAHNQTRDISLDDADQNRLQLASTESVEQQVYINICVEYLRAAFEELSFKEREILGGFFGVFGHKKETLAAIGEEFQIKESAALKAKDKALEKLRGICLDGKLGYWMSIRAAIREAQRDRVVARGDLGRYRVPEGCEVVE
jgi:RNA polymerase sigma factor (sigma-70 family)